MTSTPPVMSVSRRTAADAGGGAATLESVEGAALRPHYRSRLRGEPHRVESSRVESSRVEPSPEMS